MNKLAQQLINPDRYDCMKMVLVNNTIDITSLQK